MVVVEVQFKTTDRGETKVPVADDNKRSVTPKTLQTLHENNPSSSTCDMSCDDSFNLSNVPESACGSGKGGNVVRSYSTDHTVITETSSVHSTSLSHDHEGFDDKEIHGGKIDVNDHISDEDDHEHDHEQEHDHDDENENVILLRPNPPRQKSSRRGSDHHHHNHHHTGLSSLSRRGLSFQPQHATGYETREVQHPPTMLECLHRRSPQKERRKQTRRRWSASPTPSSGDGLMIVEGEAFERQCRVAHANDGEIIHQAKKRHSFFRFLHQ